jgi:hypothetical protein
MRSVATQNEQKLNRLIRSIPKAMVVDAAWLTDAGYSTSLRSQYVAAGWLERPARGVYKRRQGDLTWETVLASLQHLMHRSLHVGGRSALELHGYGPNLAPGAPTSVVVYSDEPLPSWLGKLPDMPTFETRTIAPLFPTEGSVSTEDAIGAGRTVAPLDPATRYPAARVGARASMARAPRRRPPPHHLRDGRRHRRRVENAASRPHATAPGSRASVKVRRLALWFADRHAQPWRERLDRDRIDLGTGNRVLVPDGRLDPTYRITYPRSLDAGG